MSIFGVVITITLLMIILLGSIYLMIKWLRDLTKDERDDYMSKKKVRYDGIEFDSELEASHYRYFQNHENIEIVELQKTFILYEGFDWIDISCKGKPKTRRGRDARYTPDFILKVKGLDKPVAVETKGYARKEYKMRKKAFLRLYPDYYFVEVGAKKSKRDTNPINEVFDRYK